jgi:hypothetical protein
VGGLDVAEVGELGELLELEGLDVAEVGELDDELELLELLLAPGVVDVLEELLDGVLD